MSDDGRGYRSADEDRLPWLEAAEEEEPRDGPPLAKLIGAIVIGLVAIGVVVGGLFWLREGGREGGDGELIAAPEGDYKVKPADPGGMDVAGAGETVYSASEGVEPRGRLATEVPERPVTKAAPATPRRPQPQAEPEAAPQRPSAPSQPGAAPSATIQLGAFSSPAGATRAWTVLSGRFRYLAPLSHAILPVRTDDRTLYRLRASGPDATDVCRRLQIAGEACTVVD